MQHRRFILYAFSLRYLCYVNLCYVMERERKGKRENNVKYDSALCYATKWAWTWWDQEVRNANLLLLYFVSIPGNILVFMMISKIGCLKKQTSYLIWCSNKAAAIQSTDNIGLSERLWIVMQRTWKEILTLKMVMGDLYFMPRERHVWRSWNDKEHSPLR